MIKQVAANKLELAITRSYKRMLFESLLIKPEQLISISDVSRIKITPKDTSIIKIVDLAPKENPLQHSTSVDKSLRSSILLPPIVAKKDLQTSLAMISETHDSPIKESQTSKTKRSDKQGFLLIGDMITLLSKDSNDEVEFTGVISGDGISHVHLECIPKAFFTEYSTQVLIRQSLFRVEPSRQYGYSSMLQNYKKMKKQDTDVLNKLKEQAEEEQKGNEAELNLSYGRKVTYGERIQLRHIHSDSFLTASLEVARERGCLQVILDHKGSEGSWFEIIPKDKLRKEGEPVRYSDFFTLVTQVEKSVYHLHMAISQIYRQDMECELNASSTVSIWTARKFISQSQMKMNPNYVATGDSFRIFHNQCEGYLSVTPRKIDEILPSEAEGSLEGKDEVYSLNYVKQRPDLNKESKMKVYIETCKSSLSVWELERKNTFVGGLAEPSGEYRIKNVATGLFLYTTKNGSLKLTTDGSNDHTLFKLIPENRECPYLTFKSLVKFENIRLQKVLKAGGHESLKSIFQSSKSLEEMEVKLTLNRKLETRTTFMLEDEPEESTIHIYQISRIIPKLVSFYYFLSTWGMFKRNVTYVLNYELARSTENELERQSEILIEIMNNLRKRILKEDPSMASMLNERQDAIRQSGLLDMIIKIVQLIENRLSLPLKFPKELMPKAIRKSNVKMLNEIVKLQYDEYLNYPQVVAVKHLYKLAIKLYETIFLCIKNNIASCQSLKKYDEFLSTQLSSYKLQVGMILKESFTYSVDIFSKATSEQFHNWIEQIKPINEYEDNIEEQIITFKILASLCVYNDTGVPKYQTIIEKELFARESRLIQFLLSDGRPCIKLYPDTSSSLREFMNNNPTLQKISVPQDPEAPMPNLFFVSSFTPHKFLVDYISAILELLSSMCMSRNESNAQRIIKEMNLTFEHLFSCMRNPNIHCKLRKHYTMLCRVLYVDRDPQMPITECANRIFMWNSEENKIEDEPRTSSDEIVGIIKRLDNSSVPIAALSQWLEDLWINTDTPFNESRDETTSHRIRFVIELLEISKIIVNLQYVSYHFIINVCNPITKLIHSKDDVLSKMTTSKHWCTHLKDSIKPFAKEENRRDRLIVAALSFFQVACVIRTNKQIFEFLKILESKQATSRSLKEMTVHMQELDFHKSKKRHQKNKSSSAEIYINSKTPLLMNTNRKRVRPDDHNAFQQDADLEENLNFDGMLLNLLFNSYNKTIKQKSLELILNNFNQKLILKDSLREICLLPTGPLRDKLRRMKFIILKINLYAKKLVLLTDTFDSKTGVKEDQELRKIKINTKNNVDELNGLIQKKSDGVEMAFIQKMAKALGAHDSLLRFVKEDWSWLSKAEDGSTKIDHAFIELYRSIFTALTAFCYKNFKNQTVLYENTRYIVNFLGNLIGTTRLLSEILSCKRNSQTGGLIIQHMFRVMENRDNPLERPQDLKVIRSLVYDDSHHFYSICQNHVIKALLNTKKLFAIFSCETSWDLSKYTAENLKFYANMILLLAACAVHNPFTTQQCRRLIPYQILFKELRSSNLQLKIKKAYLHYFFYVYCMSSDGIRREIPSSILEELLYRVILPDFELYTVYILHLATISKKELFKIIMTKQALDLKPETQKNISKGKQLLVNLIAGVNSKEKDNISQFEDLTKEQVEALDYWKYMSSRMPYSPNIGTGLLCFIKDLSIEFKSNGEVPSPETVEILEEIRSELQALHDSLFELKFDHDDLHVDFFIREVREASLEIPYYIIETDEGVQVHKGEEDSFKFLVERLQEYIQFNTIPLDEFFADYLEIADETIDRNDFISKTKEYLRIKIRTSQIDGAINFMDPDGGEIINVYLLITELKEYFIGNPYIVKKIRNRPAVVNKQESGDINQTFAVILNGLDDEYKDSTAELRGLVKKVKKNIFDKALAKKDYSTLLKFMSNLESAFQKKDHKIYLLEIFKFMLVFEEENESEDRVTRIRAIQNLFADGGVIEMSISLISKDSDPQLVKQAFELLNKLLEYNNTSIKQKLLNHLRSSGCSFELFTFIKGQLRLTRDFFMEYQRQKESGDVFQMKLSTLKTFLPNYIPQTVSAVPKRSRDTELTIVVLLFLQLCCDNCYQPFQDYMREQTDINTKVSIDLVTELGQFLINMIGLKELKSNEHDMTAACRAVNQCFKTLADMCSGPCTPNQYILGQRRRLYKFINWIIDYPDVDMRKPSAWLEIFSSSVKFLNSLIEANQSKRVAKIFFEEISIDNLIKHATLIWKELIDGRENIIYQNNEGKAYFWLKCFEINGIVLENFEKNVIETGFDIYVLVLSLRKAHSHKNDKNRNDFFKFDPNLNENDEKQNIEHFFIMLFKHFASLFYRSPKISNIVLDLKLAYHFYSSNIGSVEINNKGILAKIYFRIPNMCKFMTNKSRNDIIRKVNRNSYQEKIDDFINRSKLYEVEMLHQQKLARYPVLDFVCCNWRFYGKFSYTLVLIINFIILFSARHEDDNHTGAWNYNFSPNLNRFVISLTIIQIILASMIFVCYIIEYFPVIAFKQRSKTKSKQMVEYSNDSQFNRVHGTMLLREIILRTHDKIESSDYPFLDDLLTILTNPECFYNVLYLIVSVLSLIWHMFYGLLLLDIIKRNSDLSNVLKSISLNWKQLTKTVMLGIIVIYLFSIIGFLGFADNYQEDLNNANSNTYCSSLAECFASTLLSGIRAGGGIGDDIAESSRDDQSNYWWLMVFNLFYFVFVIIILLNIIFGIIIDTFGELRDEKQARQRDIEQNCFICGNDRFQFEIKRIGWIYHTQIEHNIHAYLAFLVYISHKNMEECTGAEKYVKELVEKNDISFFPRSSISLEEKDEETDEQMTQYVDIEQKIKNLSDIANSIK